MVGLIFCGTKYRPVFCSSRRKLIINTVITACCEEANFVGRAGRHCWEGSHINTSPPCGQGGRSRAREASRKNGELTNPGRHQSVIKIVLKGTQREVIKLSERVCLCNVFPLCIVTPTLTPLGFIDSSFSSILRKALLHGYPHAAYVNFFIACKPPSLPPPRHIHLIKDLGSLTDVLHLCYS